MLCDQCGMLWRKYADVKSSRVDEGVKGKVTEKREGAVVPGPVAKRIKVRDIWYLVSLLINLTA